MKHFKNKFFYGSLFAFGFSLHLSAHVKPPSNGGTTKRVPEPPAYTQENF
jgi:hypothetical protein